MKKKIYISVWYFVFHLVIAFFCGPFIVSFGGDSWIKKLVLLFTDFPVAYSDEFSSTMFFAHFFINGAFWALMLFVILVTAGSVRKWVLINRGSEVD